MKCGNSNDIGTITVAASYTTSGDTTLDSVGSGIRLVPASRVLAFWQSEEAGRWQAAIDAYERRIRAITEASKPDPQLAIAVAWRTKKPVEYSDALIEFLANKLEFNPNSILDEELWEWGLAGKSREVLLSSAANESSHYIEFVAAAINLLSVPFSAKAATAGIPNPKYWKYKRRQERRAEDLGWLKLELDASIVATAEERLASAREAVIRARESGIRQRQADKNSREPMVSSEQSSDERFSKEADLAMQVQWRYGIEVSNRWLAAREVGEEWYLNDEMREWVRAQGHKRGL